jgi:hypothetical protein
VDTAVIKSAVIKPAVTVDTVVLEVRCTMTLLLLMMVHR